MSFECESEIRKRMITYCKILSSDINYRDSLIRPLSSLKSPKLRSNKHAINELLKNKFIKHLHTELCFMENKLDLIIGGSTAISAVYLPIKIIPNDIDMYIKNCNMEKLSIINNIIQQYYNKYEIIIIRNPVTITWIIHDGRSIIQQIQLVILNIKSWADIFITFHGDITCIAYEFITDKFIYMSNRWENILIDNKIHYFSNIINLDTVASLTRAVEKYRSRGFNCHVIEISSPLAPIAPSVLPPLRRNRHLYMSDSGGSNLNNFNNVRNNNSNNNVNNVNMSNVHITNEVLKYLIDKYHHVISNICFSNNITDLYNDNQPLLPALKMAEFSDELLNIPGNIKLKCNCFNSTDCQCICPIDLGPHHVFVYNKSCTHKIAISTYINHPNITQCPLCRAPFDPILIKLNYKTF